MPETSRVIPWMKTGDNLQFAFWAQLAMIDVFTIVVALVILVAVARWVRPVRPITAFFLALLAGAWLWANLRDPGWQEVWNEGTPEGVDPFTRAMFWRGWPIAPFMLCLIRSNRFRTGGGEGLAIVFNWLVLCLVLSLARLICERWSHRRDGRTRAANLCAVQ